MAKAYPNSKFIGFDNHQASIERTRELAREEGLSEEQIKFEVFSSNDYPSYSKDTEKYDLIAFFDCLHDMGDPIGATSYALKSLKPDGTVMIVEPFANNKAGIINTVNCAKKIAGVGRYQKFRYHLSVSLILSSSVDALFDHSFIHFLKTFKLVSARLLTKPSMSCSATHISAFIATYILLFGVLLNLASGILSS